MDNMDNVDPVFKDDKGWWFYTETWANMEGPFASEEEARSAMEEYARNLG
jgi:hypothetical protein